MARRYRGFGLMTWFLCMGLVQGQPPGESEVVEAVLPTAAYRIAGRTVHYKEMPRYRRSLFSHGVELRCHYADYRLLNPGQWIPGTPGREILEIDLVYSKYPLDTAQWRTPFTRLMTERMQSILALDPRFRKADVHWNLVAQTDCRSEPEAQALFHGFVVKYRVNLAEIDDPAPEHRQEAAYVTVKLIMGGPQQKQSLLSQLLEQHPQWQNRTVVLDWTASMYTHGAQLMNWYRTSVQRSAFRNLIIFNDGNDFDEEGRRRQNKPIGQTGGMYTADPNDLADVLTAMEMCMLSGDGGDPAENDLEALWYAHRTYPGTDPLLLVADNSRVRDLELVETFPRPVHILLVNPDPQLGAEADYLDIAWKTGGSLFTRRDSLAFAQPRAPLPRGGIRFLGQTYWRNPLTGHLQRQQ